MSKDRYVALLRGINVGGKNVIRMEALRAAFEAMGFREVRTYIQSGNVVFSSARARRTTLAAKVEAGLSDAFGYESRVVIVASAELSTIVAEAPADFGTRPADYRYDVIFPRAPVEVHDVLPQVQPKPGVDSVSAGTHALYFRRLIARATQSKLTKLLQRPIYKDITIRNWNTTRKLLAMVTAAE
jgi:uncharacterized protein (DUF1697 family)